MAKLNWDPGRDVKELLDEWCTRCGGPTAAPALRSYFDRWESFWARIGESTWFRPATTFQRFDSPGYLREVSPADMAECRLLLETALAGTRTRPQRVRVGKLLQAFEYYEASVLSYPRESVPVGDASAAIAVLKDIERTFPRVSSAAARRLALVDEFESDPLLRHPLRPEEAGLMWSPWNPSEFWHLHDYLVAQESFGGRVTDWLVSRVTSDGPLAEYAKLLLGVSRGILASRLVNGSFESGGIDAPPWVFWIRETGVLQRTVEHPHSGTASVVAARLLRGGPTQTFACRPGLLATRAFIESSGTYDGTVQVGLDLFDSSGAEIGQVRGDLLQIDPAPGWHPLTSLADIPSTIGGRVVASVKYLLILDGLEHDANLYIDDIAAWQVSDQ